ncbi:MAG TPA: hypothetical protein ENG87_01935 [Candidatus Pacearchaeota archaeon]|nr:hypothetical protein [Candidatus Pacearchaeota archaeon]HDZ60134.1 hypothetical protein [Candidatus Pacearchaeota archaeon]HDZ60702.1 hypothetical protein [Candidatus Pacearchaeota archaeon]
MKDIKQILQREINYHQKEIEKHKELAEQRDSKKEKAKALKHLHKRFQTIKIVNELDLDFCQCCGGIK